LLHTRESEEIRSSPIGACRISVKQQLDSDLRKSSFLGFREEEERKRRKCGEDGRERSAEGMWALVATAGWLSFVCGWIQRLL